MKKLLRFLLITVVLLSFCACSSGNSSNTEINLPSNGKKGPSADLIQADISTNLSEINPHATLVNVETIKSLTENSNYEITVEITASTKYANWQYKLTMCYTKYDQGWMQDDAYVNSATYTVTQYPDAADMTALVNGEFPNEGRSFSEAVPASDGQVTTGGSIEDGILKFAWTKLYDFKHGSYSIEYISYWKYDSESDSWKLIPYSETEDASDEFPILKNNQAVKSKVDFSGTWGGEIKEFTISNFTGDSFDAHWDGNSSHFTITDSIHNIPVDRSSTAGLVYYNDGSNNYFAFDYSESGTTIIWDYWKTYRSSSLISYASITEDLPTLS